MNEVTEKLVSTAWELARIQIEGVKDFVGFSNADKNLGAHLAAVVEADPYNEDAVRRLAALVGVKYQRQAVTIAGSRFLEDFKALAKGTKLTPEDRLAARMTIVAQPDVHPKFGARILFSFQFHEEFAHIIKDNGGKAFHGVDGWKWAVPTTILTGVVAKLKAAGAKIVGSLDVSDIDPEIQVNTGRVIGARLDGKYVFLTFAYDVELVEAMRQVNPRKYFSETKEHRISAADLAQVTEHLSRVGDDVDVSALVALADKVGHLARPTAAQEPVINLKGYIPEAADQLQREGLEWLVRPINEVRQTCVGGSSIRGYVLADKPGIGKTLQAAVAAKATLEAMNPSGRIVVITPGNHKIGWSREIARWCGDDQTIQVLNSASTIDSTARWVVVNYDILDKHYKALMELGFDVLIVDEAHYAKNHEAMRSKLVVGGTQKLDAKLSDAQKKRITEQFIAEAKEAKIPVDKAKLKKAVSPKQTVRIEGLASAARLRVFPLTGTPLDNRPKDLFAQIRMIGHPLGRNFRDFALRYCNPTYKKVGKRLYTEYEGKSNLAELRERLESVWLQRHANVSGGGLHRTWTPVELDLTIYHSIMAEYDEKRRAKELKTQNDHLAYYNEARRAAAMAMVPNTIQSVESVVEADEKVIVFSYYTDVIDQLKAHFGDKALVIDGRVSNNINKEGSSKRQDVMDKFQNDPSVKVLIGQLQAAGVAVTLTAASYVKFNDMDWKPGTHFQCERRAYRRTQTKDVFVEYMVAAGTFYEELATMLEEKLAESNEFEGTNETLFERLVERLNTEAPRNEGVRQLMAARQRGNKSPARAA